MNGGDAFSVQPLCSLCLCGGSFVQPDQPQRHREHRGCTENNQGFLLGVAVPGILTAGGRGVFCPYLRAKRPVRVNAIRFSESAGWSTVTLIARYVPS